MAQWSLDTKGDTLSGFTQLLVGKNRTLIVSAGMAVDKQDPTGKKQQVVFDLEQGEGQRSKLYLSVMSDDKMQAEIAEKTVRSFAQAAGIAGVLKPETLKKFADKVVIIEAAATEGKKGTKNEGKTFVNVRAVFPDDGEEGEGEEEETPAPKPEPEEEEEEEAEEEAKPAPAAGKKARPW